MTHSALVFGLNSSLPSSSLRLTKQMFDAGGVRTIHNDDEAAKLEGLPSAIAVGPQVCCLIFGMMRSAFGKGWVDAGKADLTFRRPINSDAFVTARGIVVGKRLEADSIRIECKVWIETIEDTHAIVGTASALVPTTL